MPTTIEPPSRPREDWETRLRYRPTAAQVRALMASEGDDAAEACLERWGDFPSHLIRNALRPRRGARSPQI